MKLRNVAFWIMAAPTASVLVAPAAHSQTERFSASLSGANEVPPINTAGTGNFEMTIQPGDDHLLVRLLRPVVDAYCGPPAPRA